MRTRKKLGEQNYSSRNQFSKRIKMKLKKYFKSEQKDAKQKEDIKTRR